MGEVRGYRSPEEATGQGPKAGRVSWRKGCLRSDVKEEYTEPAEGVGKEFQEGKPACAKARGRQEPGLSAESKTGHCPERRPKM